MNKKAQSINTKFLSDTFTLTSTLFCNCFSFRERSWMKRSAYTCSQVLWRISKGTETWTGVRRYPLDLTKESWNKMQNGKSSNFVSPVMNLYVLKGSLLSLLHMLVPRTDINWIYPQQVSYCSFGSSDTLLCRTWMKYICSLSSVSLHIGQ